MNPLKKPEGSLIKGGDMSRAFDFNKFDLEIAKSLGEVPIDTQLDQYVAHRPETSVNLPPTTEASDTMKKMFGIKALGSVVLPPSIKPRS